MKREENRKKTTVKQDGKLLPVLFVLLGTLLMLAVIATYVTMTVPKWLGCEVYHVETGSMGAALPKDSVVYVKPVAPEDVEPGDVIAYAVGDGVVIHRVVQHNKTEGRYTTRGDANTANDEPVRYGQLVGKMVGHIPLIGALLAIYASPVGKLYAVLLAACGLMLCLLGLRMRKQRYEAYRDALRQKVIEDAKLPEKAAQPDAEEEPLPKKTKKHRWLWVPIVLLLLVFLGSGAALWMRRERTRREREHNEQAADVYTSDQTEPTAADAAPDTERETDAQTQAPPEAPPPITVDFDTLCATYPDVVGWIYCPDTPIDYAVMQGADNDAYLHHSYDGSYSYSGAIFVEAANRGDFTDGNTVIYGHNMLDGSMFHCLNQWRDPAFAAEHPALWLFTPKGDYRIEIFSAHTTDARSGCYERSFPAPELQRDYVRQALEDSDLDFGWSPEETERLVLLSTCAYDFDEARYVLHGRLVPLPTCGGKPAE